jgi:hypothetical protein
MIRFFSAFGLLVLLVSTPLMGSCGRMCTTAGCGYTMTIYFVGEDSWEPGTWEISLEESEELVGSCTIELPESTSSSGISCSGRLSLQGGDTRVDSVHTEYDFTDGRPITLTIRRNGEQVTQSTLEPNFERYYPNGPDCGGGCWRASVQYAF